MVNLESCFENLHPLCSETSLTCYVLILFSSYGGRVIDSADSAVYAAICGGGSECTNAASVVQVKSAAVYLASENWIRGLQEQQASVCSPVLRSFSCGSKRHGNQVIER